MATKHKPKRRGGVSRANVRQAELETFLRTSPEQSALRLLMSDARDNLISGTKADRGAAGIVSRSARAARPTVEKDYGGAITQATAQQQAVEGTLRALGPAAAPFLAAIAREGGGTVQRLTESRASSLGELTGRESDAAAGLASAIRTRRAQYEGDVKKVRTRQLDVAREAGAFKAATLGDLEKADEDRAARDKISRRSARTTRRGQDMSHADRQAALAAKKAADAAKPGKPRLTPDQRGAADDQLTVARRWISRLTKAGWSSSQIRQTLETGGSVVVPRADATGAKDPKTGKVKMKEQTITVPKISHAGPIKAHALINAAYDLEVLGYLSPPNRKALRGVPGLPKRSPVGNRGARGSRGRPRGQRPT